MSLFFGLLGMSVAASMSYAERIASLEPLCWFRMGQASGTTVVDEMGGASMTLSGTGITHGVADPIEDDADTATQFDGSSGGGSVPLDLTPFEAISVEFWAYQAAWSNDDRVFMEHTPNTNNYFGGWFVDPNTSVNANFTVRIRANTGHPGIANDIAIFRPTAAAWHHYVITFDLSETSDIIKIYVDGVLQTYSKAVGSAVTSFANSTLYIGHRGESGGLRLNGRLDEIAIYPYMLTPTQILGNYNAGIGA
ncbi:MAG: LamG domain-containing protein [Verrucomicrobiota bacterium]